MLSWTPPVDSDLYSIFIWFWIFFWQEIKLSDGNTAKGCLFLVPQNSQLTAVSGKINHCFLCWHYLGFKFILVLNFYSVVNKLFWPLFFELTTFILHVNNYACLSIFLGIVKNGSSKLFLKRIFAALFEYDRKQLLMFASYRQIINVGYCSFEIR